ncbi:hypothetical protein CHS0354_025313 [Potamilus streckersoni]|uniref:YqaJ viral recombinase domain-containing protein n=1 Tax=Potamilus streckersoni TaxID=2493646 RepID=A0AAE0VKA3_9BIVA|nr:hypothetical protein CHS0354_025313 [Potamilus streckersoni]
MEINVAQRSREWFDLRANVCITSSKFGDAVGVGKGKPWHFFLAHIKENTDDDHMADNPCLQHGIEMEKVICEAYELLTGHKTRESGVWVPKDGMLKGLVAASPDAIVCDPSTMIPVGLCEFKAPVYKIYADGIPRHYMAQIQGQMAITNLPWCDFMAVCTRTREITLQRVFFHQGYWQHVSTLLYTFCMAVQESRQLNTRDINSVQFHAFEEIKKWTGSEKIQGEEEIVMQNLLHNKAPHLCGPSKVLFTYDLLLGVKDGNSSTDHIHQKDVISQIDKEIEDQEVEREMIALDY